MKPQVAFDQAGYWKKRHVDLEGDPRSVGNLAASLEQNLEGERDFQDTVSSLATHLKATGVNSVLDLGCGIGRAAPPFLNAGIAYTGIDVSEVALVEARKRAPKATFECADLGVWNPTARYDAVSILYVLVHFVDDAAWRRFLGAAVAASTKHLIIADWFPAERTQTVPHAVSRSIKEYEATLGMFGFSIGPMPFALPGQCAKHFQLCSRIQGRN